MKTSTYGRENIFNVLLVVAFCASFATGRWGSWLGISSFNIFFIDLILLAGTFLGARYLSVRSTSRFSSIILALYIIFEIIYFVDNEFKFIVRDLAPFLYLLLVPSISKRLPSYNYLSLIRNIGWACVINALINNLSVVGILKPTTCSLICGVPLFSQRSDQTAIALGVGVLCFQKFQNSKSRIYSAAQVFLIFSLAVNYSRTSIIVLCILVLLGIMKFFIYKQNFNFARVFSLILGSSILFGGYLASDYALDFSYQSSFQRISLEEIRDEAIGVESGTFRSRIVAQELTMRYWLDNSSHVFGAGPGSAIVQESGAFLLLSGNSEVRYPHNWLVSLVSRFGILGSFVWLFIVINYSRNSALKSIKKVPENMIYFEVRRFFIVPVILILFLTSLFGVVFEAPFGMVPLLFILSLNLSLVGHLKDLRDRPQINLRKE